ncbi:MAG: M61 family metallopeptidase [Vicinamibacterales bacterium]
MPAKLLTTLLVGVALMMTVPVSAQTAAPPLQYTLRFPAPHTHYVEVEARVPAAGRREVELMMAVWTPGSYMVREYARHVEGVEATGAGGRALAIDKSRKNRWTVRTDGADVVTVRYRVYGREMTVRTNWVEAGFAMLNGAPTFLTLADGLTRPHEVTIEPAAGWATSMTGLAEMPGGPHRYRAPDFDTLVDSPILVGNPAVYELTVGGKRHYLVNEGESGTFDGARAARDLETLVAAHLRLWGQLPYDKYVFLNLITEAGGGLEHKNSTVLMTTRWATRTRRAYLGWLDLASHEYFHAWNIKRLRPVELGPFDYENENHTRSLWIAEGVTDYYSELVVHRAGLSTQEEYLDGLSNQIEQLQTTPGRLVQSVGAASFDAWIKYYRPDENTVNTAISYYTKGFVIGFLLDARIRAATDGTRSLDDVMRLAYDRFAGDRGYTPAQFQAVAEEVAGVSLDAFFDRAAESTEELEYADALQALGLRFRPAAQGIGSGGRAWLGLSTRNDNGRLIVTQVRRDTPGYAAGVNVDDEILAIDDIRVRADRLDNRLEQYRPGTRVTLLVARREALVRLEAVLGAEPARAWRLEVDPTATPAQARRRGDWLAPAVAN